MDPPDDPAPAPLAPPDAAFRVGAWTVEPGRNRIGRSGEHRRLEPRVMRLLATLAAAPGRPFSRAELLDAVWPDVTVNEEALSRAVSQLRRALDDDSRSPRYVETVHKSGYCLIAAVRVVGNGEPAAARAAEGDAPEPRRRRLAMRAAAAAATLLILAAIGFLLLRPAGREAEGLAAVPLTSDPGREIDPALSADGTRLAYVASAGGGYDLFWRPVGEERPVRLTRDERFEGHPAWSPDGRRLAYVASAGGGEGAAIHVVDIAGAGPRSCSTFPPGPTGSTGARMDAPSPTAAAPPANRLRSCFSTSPPGHRAPSRDRLRRETI
jgi:DNA-binding winged helix-turn-helix (wHTH) protein